MNHREMAHHKMHEAVLGVLDDNHSIWQANAALTAAHDALKTGNELVVTLQSTQAGVITGITQDKHTARRQLCEAAVLVAGAVAAYADSQSNHELFETVNFTVADLLHEAEEKCETDCGNILQAGTDNLAAITPSGTLTQIDLDDLEGRVRRRRYRRLLPSEPDGNVSVHPAQAVAKPCVSRAGFHDGLIPASHR